MGLLVNGAKMANKPFSHTMLDANHTYYLDLIHSKAKTDKMRNRGLYIQIHIFCILTSFILGKLAEGNRPGRSPYDPWF